uniref:Uncharacterized protein n=1 Tax=Zooxanthella nutricula TaxID=1333877 RepID=A0A7S2PTA5_9DINO
MPLDDSHGGCDAADRPEAAAGPQEQPGSNEEQKEEHERQQREKSSTHVFRVSPELFMVIADIFFFGTFVVGWVITALYNHDFILDNNIVRVFGVYNICIGVDSMPARLVTIPMSYLSLASFLLTGLAFIHRICVEVGRFKVLRIALFIISLVLLLCFTWSIGIEPNSVANMRYHLNGFALACWGWSLLKIGSCFEFAIRRRGGLCGDTSCTTWTAIIFVANAVFTAVFLLLFGMMLFFSMLARSDALLEEKLAAVDGVVEGSTDWYGVPLIVTASMSLVIGYLTVPESRRGHVSIVYARVSEPTGHEFAELAIDGRLDRVSAFLVTHGVVVYFVLVVNFVLFYTCAGPARPMHLPAHLVLYVKWAVGWGMGLPVLAAGLVAKCGGLWVVQPRLQNFNRIVVIPLGAVMVLVHTNQTLTRLLGHRTSATTFSLGLCTAGQVCVLTFFAGYLWQGRALMRHVGKDTAGAGDLGRTFRRVKICLALAVAIVLMTWVLRFVFIVLLDDLDSLTGAAQEHP